MLRKLSILLNFLFPFVSFIGVFSILKCKTWVLKTTTWWKRASHFLDGWHLLKCQIRSPPKLLTWPLGVCGGVGYGWLYWFSLRIFSQTSLELEIFPEISRCNIFFSALYVMKDSFFSAGCFFSGIYLHAFFLPKSACSTFFSEITHNPLKSHMVGP